MLFFNISPEAVQTASTFTLFSIFTLGFACIWAIIYAELKNKKLTYKSLMAIFKEKGAFRIPAGFLLILLGLMIRTIAAIPKNIYLYNGLYSDLLKYNEYITPYLTIGTEFMVYIGACIIFWPSIQILSMRIFKNPNKKFLFASSLLIALVFKILMTIVGIMVFYGLVNLFT